MPNKLHRDQVVTIPKGKGLPLLESVDNSKLPQDVAIEFKRTLNSYLLNKSRMDRDFEKLIQLLETK